MMKHRGSALLFLGVPLLLGVLFWSPSVAAQAECYTLLPCMGRHICDDDATDGFTLVSGVNICNEWVLESPCEVWPGSPRCKQAVDTGTLEEQARLAWLKAQVDEVFVAGARVVVAAEVPSSVPRTELAAGWAAFRAASCTAFKAMPPSGQTEGS